jgi:UDP-glucose 4-epimerase
MRSVLITGAAGFIGSQLAAHFTRECAQVFVDTAATTGAHVRAPRVVLSAASLLQATGGAAPEAIIHAAGSGTVAQVAAMPHVELPANQAALLAVLEFARQHAPQARVVLLSSAALYGNAPSTPQKEVDAREPVSLYGVSKAQAEQLAAFYALQHGLRAAAVRLSTARACANSCCGTR